MVSLENVMLEIIRKYSAEVSRSLDDIYVMISRVVRALAENCLKMHNALPAPDAAEVEKKS